MNTVLALVLMAHASAQYVRFASGMSRDYDARVLRPSSRDTNAWVDMPDDSREARIQLHAAQRRGNGGYHRYTVSRTAKYTKGVLAIIVRGNLGSCSYYTPHFKSVSIDYGRAAHSCHWAESSLVGNGLTPLIIHRCSDNWYRSRSAWKKTCKRQGTVQVMLKGSDNLFKAPSGNPSRNRSC